MPNYADPPFFKRLFQLRFGAWYLRSNAPGLALSERKSAAFNVTAATRELTSR